MGWIKNFDPGHVNFFLLRPTRVYQLWFGFGKFLLKVPKILIFTIWIKKYPGQRRVGLLFSVGLKYARVGSGQGPYLVGSWV